MKKYYLQSSFFILLCFYFPNILHAQWQQIGEDIVGDMTYEYYGNAMNLCPDGSTVAIASQANPENFFTSFVRVYKENSGTWQPIGNDIDAADGDNSDAIALSANGNRIAIGSIRNGENNGQANFDGHVRIFDLVEGNWQQVGNDIVGTGGENAGSAVSINADGSVLVLGAHFNDENGMDAGQVRVYRENEGEWQQVGQSLDGDVEYDNFGYTVDINSDGSIIAIGAPFNNNSRGQSKIYKNVNDNWIQVGNDILGGTDDILGHSISINTDGTFVAMTAIEIISSSVGHVRIYKFEGTNWQQVGDNIYGDQTNGFFGRSLSLSGNGSIVAIGGSQNTGEQSGSGDVRIYKNNNDEWTQIGQDIDGEFSDDDFGGTVSLSSDGSRVAVAAFLNDQNGYQAGYVQIYENETILGISDFSKSNISVYPNPSSGQFYLINAELFHLKITDINGKLLYQSKINDNSTRLVLNNILKTGIYFIQLQSNTQHFVVKHIVK